jgi:hypothetical protein
MRRRLSAGELRRALDSIEDGGESVEAGEGPEAVLFDQEASHNAPWLVVTDDYILCPQPGDKLLSLRQIEPHAWIV